MHLLNMTAKRLNKLLPGPPIFENHFNLFAFSRKFLTLPKRKPKKRRNARKIKELEKAPARKAIVLKVTTKKPKKPNSAQRKVAICKLTFNNKTMTAYIPGEGHNLQQHSVILVQPKRRKDIGTKIEAIRGVYDLAGVEGRVRSRSRYGTKKPPKEKIE
ncbi:hypothetical protein MHBO_001228 [Bonamia ostreae]|uniref:Ribosomal protein S12 n=1 Tax=Bonamia ostreae TaxID=126728 RepID=A0ABV2AJG9_9EUKA